MFATWRTFSQPRHREFRVIRWFLLWERAGTFTIIISLREELVLLDLIWLDCFVSWLPVSRAHLAVLVSVLEALDQSNCLLNIPTDCIVVDLYTADHVFVVEDEHAADRSSPHRIVLVGDQDAIVFADLFADVCDQWIVNRLAEAALGARCFEPGQVSEVTITGDTEDLCTELLEFINTLAESDELRGTHVGEVKWVKNQDDPLSFQV